MSRYPAELTSEETALVERVNAEMQRSACADNPNVSDAQVRIDTQRHGAYILVVYEFSLDSRGIVTFSSRDIQALLALDASIQDVVVSFSVDAHAYLVTVDIARPGIRALHARPLVADTQLPEIIVATAEHVKNTWQRSQTTSDAQCSLALCVGSHLVYRVNALMGGTGSLFPKLQIAAEAGSEATRVFARFNFRSGEYTATRRIFEYFQGVSKYVDEVKVVLEPEMLNKTMTHWIAVVVRIGAVPESARNWEPYYTPPAAGSLRESVRPGAYARADDDPVASRRNKRREQQMRARATPVR